MNNEIRFNDVLRDPRSWSDEMNVDIMMENNLKLKPIIDKMFFTRWPKHPENFTLLFSKEEFADKLIDTMVRLGIANLNRVWFTEYEGEDKERLIEMGVLNQFLMSMGLCATTFSRVGEDCYVNVIV